MGMSILVLPNNIFLVASSDFSFRIIIYLQQQKIGYKRVTIRLYCIRWLPVQCKVYIFHSHH
jgi:hypothetical protein